jgi:hypothetical protein
MNDLMATTSRKHKRRRTVRRLCFRLVGFCPMGLLLLALVCGCWHRSVVTPSDESSRTLGFFEDKTLASGIDVTYHNGEEADHYTILESLGGGIALIDYDGDGLLDVFVPGGGVFGGPDGKTILGRPSRLYRNLGDWKFEDVTSQTGVDRPVFYTHGCAVADYDRDGWPDLLVTGWDGVALYHNESDGQKGRRFVEVAARAGLSGTGWTTGAAWGDLDGDGFPDLYLCRYTDWSLANNPSCPGDSSAATRDICSPRAYKAVPHLLYRNNGDGTFTEIGASAGLCRGTSNDGYGLGVLIVDVNNDGRPDLYIANDSVENFLYLNSGPKGEIRLKEVGMGAGVAVDDHGQPNGSMGVDAADYDDGGRPSIWVTNFVNENPALYHNECRGQNVFFRYATLISGISAIGRSYVSFGTGFLDVDNDGREDLVIANGHVLRHPTHASRQQRAVLLHNQGGGRFTEISTSGGDYFRRLHMGRGLAVGDLDNDGYADLAISHSNEPMALLRNVTPKETGAGHHWLGIALLGRNKGDVVGAKAVVESGGRRSTRFVKGGGSYLSSGDRRLLFGLGTADTVERVRVTWPSGQEQSWDGLMADRYWRLEEGKPKACEGQRGL